jgi:hypothetical protein
LKETYSARLRELEYRVAIGAVAETDDIIRAIEAEYAVVKERFLISPGKMADRLVGKTRNEIEQLLREEVTEILSELSTVETVPDVVAFVKGAKHHGGR